MATSEHQTTSPAQQDHDQQLIRRSSGRRKAKGGDSKKHKQPRRGMGVAKLELLRLQTTETDQPGFQLPVSEMNTSSPHWYAADFAQMGSTRNPIGYPGFYALSGSDPLRLLQNHEPDFFGKNSDAIGGNVVKCYSLHCNACHKKKKINGDRRFLGLDLGDVGAKAPQTLGNYGNKVEVVAVHRKGASSWHGGNGGVLMEYDFFPSANVDGGGEESGMNMMKEEVGVCSRAGFDESKCVDLSLKLSY